MLASLLARTSQGISYPYLYLNSAASPLALVTQALASAMEPVRTHPTEGEILKMCETDDGSISLSYARKESAGIFRVSGWLIDIQGLSFAIVPQHSLCPLRQRT